MTALDDELRRLRRIGTGALAPDDQRVEGVPDLARDGSSRCHLARFGAAVDLDQRSVETALGLERELG